MKRLIAIVMVIAVSVAAFAVSIQYKKAKVKNDTDIAVSKISTTAYNVSTTEAKGYSNDKPVAETEDKEYQIYFDGKVVTIVHGDLRHEMINWDAAFKLEIPQAISRDCDGDGNKELLLNVIDGIYQDEDGSDFYTYAIFMFKPTVNNGKAEFSIIAATSETWKTPFDNKIRYDVVQLPGCKKILQFTMENMSAQINYDEKTGIAQNEHVGYVKALENTKKEYYTMSGCSKGLGVYKLDSKGNITLDIQMLVSYEGLDKEQNIGNVHCDIGYIDGALSIVPKTMKFVPNKDFKVNDPRDTAENNWSVTISNVGSKPNFKSTDIDWVENDFDLTKLSEKQSVNFDSMPSKIKCVDTVKFTQSGVTLTAREGYNFSTHIREGGKFSAIINRGEKDELDIAYTCTIKTVENRSTLIITFDKTYDKNDLKNVIIKYGV